MAAAPVWVTGALPITVVPVLLDALVGPVPTASPAEADCRDDAGAGFEHPARVAARTIPAQPSRSGTIQLPLYRDGMQVRVLPGAPSASARAEMHAGSGAMARECLCLAVAPAGAKAGRAAPFPKEFASLDPSRQCSVRVSKMATGLAS